MGIHYAGFSNPNQRAMQVNTDHREKAATPINAAFEVCHVGVVLRAVLFVHAVVMLGILPFVNHWLIWFDHMIVGAMVALPAVLLWLIAMCACKRLLLKNSAMVHWGVAIFLGGAASELGLLMMLLAQGEMAASNTLWLHVLTILLGAVLAVCFFYTLVLRQKTRFTADAHARFAELQARIRPHFLFNTLNTAMALVRLDPKQAEKVLEDLAELFRVALNDSGQAVHLSDEIALAERYLAIEKMRFGDRLQIEWQLDERANLAKVPPLLLQPLVENAVRHGIEPLVSGGLIQVHTQVLRNRVMIRVINDLPMGPKPVTLGHGMALNNVRERLMLMHDVAAQFDIQTTNHQFCVEMGVPL
jgi:two-component system, LytTR family, sensor histidine kinase AlgZ